MNIHLCICVCVYMYGISRPSQNCLRKPADCAFAQHCCEDSSVMVYQNRCQPQGTPSTYLELTGLHLSAVSTTALCDLGVLLKYY